jgi:ATP-binding cassette subfamily D (ALD) protein 4
MFDEVNTEDDGYIMEGVAFKAPGRTDELVKDLCLHLKPGESLLITGSSSAGKTSLLRLLRGLWRLSRGNLTAHYTPGPCGVLFLPQKPYLTDGTLREQVYIINLLYYFVGPFAVYSLRSFWIRLRSR